jgi:hypothetical protein
MSLRGGGYRSNAVLEGRRGGLLEEELFVHVEDLPAIGVEGEEGAGKKGKESEGAERAFEGPAL